MVEGQLLYVSESIENGQGKAFEIGDGDSSKARRSKDIEKG